MESRQRAAEAMARKAERARESATGLGPADALFQEMSDLGFGPHMGIEVRGDFCLAVGRRQWQATLLRDLVSGQWMTQEMALYPDGLAFSTKQALVLIEQRGLVRPDFQATMKIGRAHV